MRVLGELGLGRSQVVILLAAGVGMAAVSAPSHRFCRGRDALVGVMPQLFLWLGCRWRWTSWWRQVDVKARLLLAAVPVFALAGIINLILKMVVGRPRPKEVLWNGVGGMDVHPFGLDAGFWSFPSGHAASTFAIAAWLALCFPRYRWLLMGVAVVLSLSRFMAGTPHYLGDVIAGAAVGGVVAWMVHIWMKAPRHG
jgi:membrane-associated phospholipid phosphatase